MSSVYETIYKILTLPPSGLGEISDQTLASIQATKTQNIQVALAYPPKVGGTFMRSALILLLARYYHAALSRGSYAATDQARDLYFPTVFKQHIVQSTPPSASVMHCHMYASRPVTAIIEAFDLRTVIQTRNILDTLVSYYNMLEKAEENGEFIANDLVMQLGKPLSAMSTEERRFAIVNIAPVWYVRFYGKWLAYSRACEEQGNRAPLWVTFTELIKSPEQLLATIAKHVDPVHDYTAAEIKKALDDEALSDKEAVRFNKGIPGRGEDFFTKAEKETIYNLMRSAGEEELYRLGVL